MAREAVRESAAGAKGWPAPHGEASGGAQPACVFSRSGARAGEAVIATEHLGRSSSDARSYGVDCGW